MTKAEFRERVKLEGRIKNSTNLDALIDSLVLQTLDDYSNKTRFDELLLLDSPLTLVAATSTIALPANYQNLFELRYGIGPSSPYTYQTLSKLNSYLRRRNTAGYPRFFIISSTGITLYPHLQIQATDSLLISYYKKPSTMYLLEDAAFPVPRIETTILKEVLSRIQRFHNSMPEAQMMKMDAQQSFIASESGR